MHHINEQKGSKVKPTERRANTASTPKTGLFATLCGLLRSRGSGAPETTQETGVTSAPATSVDYGVDGPHPGSTNPHVPTAGPDGGTRAIESIESIYQAEAQKAEARKAAGQEAGTLKGGREKVSQRGRRSRLHVGRGVVATMILATGVLAWGSASALAATPPEAKTEGPTEIKAESAVLNGVVNPNITEPVEPGKYQFLYKATKTATEAECLSGSKAPAVAEPYLGVTAEPFPQEVKGLKPDTDYVVCFVAENNAKQKRVGEPVPFETTPEKPEPTGKVKTGSITATTAEIEGGVLNPKAAGEGGEYQYHYRVSATECEGEGEGAAPETAGTATGLKKEAVPVVKLENLQPNATYAVCLIERDAGGSSLASTPIPLTTSPAPPAVEAISAPTLKATEATLEGTVNPNNESTECHFQYGTTSVTEHEIACSPGTLTGFGGQGVSSTTLNEKGETVASITGLEAGKTYKYRLLAKNGAGEESKEETFTTQPLTVSNENSPAVTASEAELSAEVGTGEDAAKYYVQYGIGSVEESSTPEVSVPASSKPVLAQQRLANLQPARTYHFRFVVSDGHTPVLGAELTFTTPITPGSATSQNCANEQRRAEQPFGLTLPDCRAYEIVSPLNTEGQNATEEVWDKSARAAEEGAPAQPTSQPTPAGESGAVTYASSGSFSGTSAESSGATAENQYVSRRDPELGGWSTQAITPLHEPQKTESGGSYAQDAFNPELTEGIALTNAPLTGRPGEGLYLADFADRSYREVVREGDALPLGVSSDLSHVVFGQLGAVYEWAGGTPFLVGVDDQNELVPASVAGWRGVSGTGSSVVFTRDGQLYVRVNADQLQSPVSQPEAEGSGSSRKAPPR
jgi:hypothetical protein